VCVAHGPQSKKRMRAVEAKLGVWMRKRTAAMVKTQGHFTGEMKRKEN